MRLYAEISMAMALGVVLDLFKIPLPHLSAGGSVSLETLPILVVAFRRGLRAGLTTGALYGVLNCLLKPQVVHPLQFLLDYPVAFGAVGSAGLWGRRAAATAGSLGSRILVLAAILLGDGLRFLAHVLSGVVFFAHYAPEGHSVWLYSLIYNASYLIPQLALHILLMQLVLRIVQSDLKER